MANDIDMWNDIEDLEENGEQAEADDLLECFTAKYNENDEELADKLQDKFLDKWGYWGNWY